MALDPYSRIFHTVGRSSENVHLRFSSKSTKKKEEHGHQGNHPTFVPHVADVFPRFFTKDWQQKIVEPNLGKKFSSRPLAYTQF